MYSVYFNNILQKQEDIINIDDVVQTSIVREDGFDNNNQILREKSDTTLSFTGDSYKYVCTLLKDDPCAIIDVLIEDECGYMFNGTIAIGGLTNDLNKCTFKAQLKDSSFSAYIDGLISTDVPLYNTKTRNCQQLNTVQQYFLMRDAAQVGIYQIFAFDVLDVFKYMLAYYTDNKITVESTFLTNNKYAITTGFNMHSHGIKITEIFPTLSFEDLFKEIRKKLRIYMGIEYNQFGKPYLRIEDEPYFFADVELFSIPIMPKDAIQTFDIKRNFNQIDIGSDTTKVQEGTTIYYPQNRYRAWNKESYGGCGTCTGERDSKLDLVSSYVIDSNVIIEAIEVPSGDEYDNDDKIFLFEYEELPSPVTVLRYGKQTLDVATGKYYYNANITNENVLQNWIDYYGKCLEIQRNAKYGFLTREEEYSMVWPAGAVSCYSVPIEFTNPVYDNENSLSASTIAFWTTNGCIPLAANPDFTQFTCVETGNFNFAAKIVNMIDTLATFLDATWDLHIVVFSDNTYSTILEDISETVLITQDGTAPTINIQLETGNIPLTIGNVVVCYVVRTQATNLVGPTSLNAEFASFELVGDDFVCMSQDYNEQNGRPYTLDFTDKLCFENYDIANKNKKGYITVAGQKQWIRELNYVNKKVSKFKLLGNDLLCGC